MSPGPRRQVRAFASVRRRVRREPRHQVNEPTAELTARALRSLGSACALGCGAPVKAGGSGSPSSLPEALAVTGPCRFPSVTPRPPEHTALSLVQAPCARSGALTGRVFILNPHHRLCFCGFERVRKWRGGERKRNFDVRGRHGTVLSCSPRSAPNPQPLSAPATLRPVERPTRAASPFSSRHAHCPPGLGMRILPLEEKFQSHSPKQAAAQCLPRPL